MKVWANLALYSVVVCLFTIMCNSKSLYFSQSVCIFHIRGSTDFPDMWKNSPNFRC